MYEREKRELFVEGVRFATGWMAIPLALSFTIVDSFYVPERLGEFMKFRLSVIPVSGILYLAYSLPLFRDRLYTFPAYGISLFLGIMTGYFAATTGGDASLYIGGINIVGTGALCFLPWTPPQLLVASACVYLPFLLLLFAAGGPINPANFVPTIAFMASTVFLAGVINYIFTTLRKQELRTRLALKTEIDGKNELIERKTREGVYLERLASQFSPQVIQAIKDGEISIDRKVRRDVSCIFIDVENSTSRSGRLDHYDYANLLSEFFSDCGEELLRHGVTIGTYLGDGLLAFVNAPQSNPRHAQVALEACMNVLKLHARKAGYYREKWRTEFNIRIGINTGYAQVGFYPSVKRGTYTVVGEPVNLASRLCARAQVNRVCVTKEFLKTVGTDLQGTRVSHQETCTTLKGFEGESFELYSISPPPEALQAPKEGSCPACGHPEQLGADLGETILVKCTQCGHTDVERRAA